MIKTTTLALLAFRFLRSNRRASVVTALSQIPVHVSLWVSRITKKSRTWKARIPEMLIFFRIALGPSMICMALVSRHGLPVAVCIALAMISDVLDGMFAKRWHVDTEDHYRWDSRADLFFYGCVFIVALLWHPAAFAQRWILLAALLVAELAHHVAAAMKYGRTASYHSMLSKIWGFMMAAAMGALLGFGLDNWILDATFAWGILCNLHGLAMTLMLPTWHENVLTLFHAARLRQIDVTTMNNEHEMVARFI